MRGDTIKRVTPRFYSVRWDGGHQWGLRPRHQRSGHSKCLGGGSRVLGCLLCFGITPACPNKPPTPSEARITLNTIHMNNPIYRVVIVEDVTTKKVLHTWRPSFDDEHFSDTALYVVALMAWQAECNRIGQSALLTRTALHIEFRHV